MVITRPVYSIWHNTHREHWPHTLCVGHKMFIVVLVVDGVKGPPGPVPIPVAKLVHADGTAPGRGWESK